MTDSGTAQSTLRKFRIAKQTEGPVSYFRLVCRHCKYHIVRVKSSGVHPMHHYFCGAIVGLGKPLAFLPEPEGTSYIGRSIDTPEWCPNMDCVIPLENVEILGEE